MCNCNNKEKKHKLNVRKLEDYDLDDLLDCLCGNVEDDITSFEDVINLEGSVNREIYIGQIFDGTGRTVEGMIRFWNKVDDKKGLAPEDRQPIKIYIDSPGGSLTDTFTMIDAIKMSKTPVWTINAGCAYSGGFFTFIVGHKRFCYNKSSFLYHEGSTGNYGDAGKFRNYAEFYIKQLDKLKSIVLENTNVSEELYESHKKDDWWLDSEEALELGICDEVIKEFV